MRQPGFYGGGAAPAAPTIIQPAYADATVGVGVWPTINAATFTRFEVPVQTVIRYFNMWVQVQSGNINAGVASVVSASATTVTYTVVASTGSIACPAGGAQRLDLGTTTLTPGAYVMFLWADNTTFSTLHGVTAGLQASRLTFNGVYASGVGASGTATTSGRYISGVSLEAA